MGKGSAVLVEKSSDRFGTTLANLAEIKPVVPTGVRQISDIGLKRQFYFKLPIVVAIKSHNLNVGIKALEKMNINAVWWYSGRSKIHFAPLYPNNYRVSEFTDADKDDFKTRLGMIASCLTTGLRDVSENEFVEILPAIPQVSFANQKGLEITQEVGLDEGHAMNYRILVLTCDGKTTIARYYWQNRRRGKAGKNEPMFVDDARSKLNEIDLTDCLNNEEVSGAIVDDMFGNSNESFKQAMYYQILDVVRTVFFTARNNRKEIEDIEENKRQLQQIKTANLNW